MRRARTTIRSPWQNGVSERWVGSCRREMLDHVIPLNEHTFRCLIKESFPALTSLPDRRVLAAWEAEGKIVVQHLR